MSELIRQNFPSLHTSKSLKNAKYSIFSEVKGAYIDRILLDKKKWKKKECLSIQCVDKVICNGFVKLEYLKNSGLRNSENCISSHVIFHFFAVFKIIILVY